MSDIIQNTINKVLGDGARVSKFKCYIQLPTPFTSIEGAELDTIIKSTVFPTRTNEVITIQHKGRDIPLPGQEKYTQELEVTFYMQEDHRNKIIFEQWAEALNFDRYSDHSDPMVVQLANNINAIKTNIELTQMNFSNEEDRCKYKFYNVFPKTVTGSAASSDTINTIGEFTVTFVYSHYTIDEEKRVSMIKPNQYLPFDASEIVSEKPSIKNKRPVIDTSTPFKENNDTWLGNLYNSKVVKSLKNID